MQFPAEIKQLLVDAGRPAKFVAEPSDTPVFDLIKYWKEVERADAGIIGIPFDTSDIGRRGSNAAPQTIREALTNCNSYNPGLDADISKLKLVDFGNVDVVHTDVLKTHERVEKVVTAIYERGIIPVAIGGDHGVSFATIKSLINVIKGNIGVINVDAHPDVRKTLHGELSSGTPFRRLMELSEYPLRGKNFVELGINSWHNSRVALDYCRKMGVTVIPAREVHQRNIADVVAQALDIASDGTKAIFLSFDIDGLDFAAAPGTGVPSLGGLTAYQGLEAVWLISQHPLVRGFDVMEVSPPLDVQGLTSRMAAELIMHFLAGTAKRLGQ